MLDFNSFLDGGSTVQKKNTVSSSNDFNSFIDTPPAKKKIITVTPTKKSVPVIPKKTPTPLQTIKQTTNNVIKNITDKIKFTFTAPKIMSPLPAEKPIMEQILKIKPGANKISIKQLNINNKETFSAQITPQAGLTPTSKVISKISSSLSKEFPETANTINSLIKDPLSLKANPNKIISDVITAFKQPLQTAIQRNINTLQPSKSISESISKELLKITGTAGVILSPIGAIFSAADNIPVLASFSKLITLPYLTLGEGAPKVSNKIIDSLPIPQKTKDNLKPAMAETLTLASQLALGRFMEVTGKKIKTTIKYAGIDAFEKITKNIIEETNSPKTISLTSDQVRDINNRGLGAKDAKDFFKTLGVEERVKALKTGMTVEFPVEKVVRVVDKPYWEKIKSYFNQAPTDRVISKTSTTKPIVNNKFGGYLTPGEYTPEQVIGKVMKAGEETTPAGREAIKAATEAQKTGQNIIVEQTKPPVEGGVSKDLYHGTNAKFDKFLPPDEVPEEYQDSSGIKTFGTYLTDNPEQAKSFGKNVLKVNANIKKPLDLSKVKTFDELVEKIGIDTKKNAWSLNNMKDNSLFNDFGTDAKGVRIDEPYRAIEMLQSKFNIKKLLMDKGYDAIIFNEAKNGIEGNTTLVFNPEQAIIKSPSVVEGGVGKEITGTKEASKYTSSKDFADAIYSARETDQIGELPSDQVIARDSTNEEGVQSYVDKIKAREAIDPVEVTKVNGKFVTVDGSHRVTAYKLLKLPVPVIYRGTDKISGLKTFDEVYKEVKSTSPVSPIEKTVSGGEIKQGVNKPQTQSPELTKAEEYVRSKKIKFRVDDKKELFALHNLSASGVDKAFEQGGIPAPSLSITKKDIKFSDFGEITLVGDKNLVDPTKKDTSVFSGDIYTPRVPRPEYIVKDIYNTSIGNELEKRGIYFGDFDSITPEEAVQRMISKATTSISDKALTEQEANKIVKQIYSDPILSVKRKTFGQDINNMIKEYPELNKIIKETRSESDFNLTITNEEKYNAFIQELADKKFNGEYYDAEKKLVSDLFEKVPYTVENKVRKAKEIIGRNLDDIRGTEQGWGMGANPRIFGYDKLSSIEQIKGTKGNLMSKEKAEKIGKKYEDALFSYLNKNKMGLDYSNSLSIFKDIVKANKFDDAIFIKKDLGQFGDFKNITLLQAKKIGQLMKLAYKNVPTDYFEVKMMRPVKLNEFKGALIPEGTLQSTIDKLKKEGLKIIEYNGPEDRLKKLNDNFKQELFRVKDDFKKATGITISDKQEAEIIKLNKEIFGDENIKITEQILANSKALGSYNDRMIKIIKGQADLKDTFYHEAVHKYLDVVLTEQEHVEMLVEAQKIYGIDDFAKVEEKLAEDFIKYAKNKEGFFGKLKLFFEKILLRIKKFLNNRKRIEELYNDILSGQKKKGPPKTPEEVKIIMKKYGELIKEGTKQMEEQIVRNEKIRADIEGLSPAILKDISILKRMARATTEKGGDIEDLYKKNSELTSRVLEAIREQKKDYELDTGMTDEQALEIAINLPTKSEIRSATNDSIKEAKKLLRESGIKLNENYEDIGNIDYTRFEEEFNQANAQLLKEAGTPKIDKVEFNKIFKDLEILKAVEERGIAQNPVGEGQLKKSKAYTRVKDRIAEEAQLDVSYNILNLEQDTQNAMNFIIEKPKQAIRVALGLESPPKGQTETAISIALADKASREGNYLLESQFEASRSLRQTRRGQEIVSERGRFSENSPHYFIKRLMDTRLTNLGKNLKGALAEGKTLKKIAIEKIDKGVTKLKQKLQVDRKKIQLAQDIIDSLRC